MPHIQLPEGVPGIRSAMVFRPEIAGPMRDLADILLRQPHSLSPGERELIATFVSARNDCRYCQTAHGCSAAQYLGGNDALVEQVKLDYEHANISDKLKSLLAIAAKVQVSGKNVTPKDIARAREQGATDLEIHDTVLLTAMFAMCNRYVDGLDTWTPDDLNIYRDMANRVVTVGYATPGWEAPFPRG